MMQPARNPAVEQALSSFLAVARCRSPRPRAPLPVTGLPHYLSALRPRTGGWGGPVGVEVGESALRLARRASAILAEPIVSRCPTRCPSSVLDKFGQESLLPDQSRPGRRGTLLTAAAAEKKHDRASCAWDNGCMGGAILHLRVLHASWCVSTAAGAAACRGRGRLALRAPPQISAQASIVLMFRARSPPPCALVAQVLPCWRWAARL